MFEPVGEPKLFFNGHDKYTNYYRELDIEKTVSTTLYKVGDIVYTRKTLAAFKDQVIVMRLTASKPHSISFAALYNTVQPNALIKTTSLNHLLLLTQL